ncbi:ABC transporter permease [Cryptosporangium sp. NPDC048952]|uniref:ABC transporter permease n=1 Tax=Cryptosporangium sp. NPDC048952 TaxID=3363961 RepID=UPI0037243D8E
MPTTSRPARVHTPTDHGGERESLLTKVLVRQETTLLVVMVLVVIFAVSRSDLFFTQSNLLEILRSSVIYFVVGCGAALLIIGGGLDFSAGAVFTLSGLVSCQLMVAGVPWPLAVLLGLALCCAVGALNWAVITYLHVPPIIATLGVYYMLTGIDNLVTDGRDVLPLPDGFLRLGQTRVAGLPSIVVIAVVIGAVFWFLLERTRFGVNVRALGGNRQAAVGNGLRVFRLDLGLYVIAAATAAIAGLLYSARVGAGQVTAGGTSTTLIAITAVLIGGVSLLGGLGNIQGIAVGAVLLSMIDNALVLTEIPPQYNSIVIGAILICAVGLDHLRRSRIYRKR